MNDLIEKQKVIDKIAEIYNSIPENLEINKEIKIKKLKEYLSLFYDSIDSLYEFYIFLTEKKEKEGHKIEREEKA